MKHSLESLTGNYPDFLIVGAAKSGTTILNHWLSCLPEVFIPEPKELWFLQQVSNENKAIYDLWPRERIPQNILSYLGKFHDASDHQVCGESSPSYLYYNDHVIKNLKKWHPCWAEVKIIIILREPIDRIRSEYRFVLQHGLDPDHMTINNALNCEEDRKIENRILADCFYKSVSLYYDQVKSYVECFNHVLILKYEELVTDPQRVLDKVCRFLGVSVGRVDFEKKVNVSRKRVSGRIVYSYELRKICDRILGVLPLSMALRKGAIGFIDFILFKKPEEISDANLAHLASIFRDDVEKLSLITDCDFSDWIGEYDKILKEQV